MAAVTLFSAPFVLALDADTNPVVGAKIYVYAAGTSSEQAVYHDADLMTAWLQPIVTNAAGQSEGPLYLTPTPALKINITDSEGANLPGFPMDDYSPSAVAT